MMRIYKKLNSKRGETLVEMLVSIALLGLAISILTAMAATAYRMNDAAEKEDAEFYEELEKAEAQTEPLSSLSSNRIVIKDKNSAKELRLSVKFYGGDGSRELRSYAYSPAL